MSDQTNVGPVIKTRDVAFTFRMGAGVPGDVTRIHPASISARLNDASGSNPATYFGQAVMFNGATNTIRAVNNAADSAKGNTTVNIAGVTVRPYPFQDTGVCETYGAAAFAAGIPPAGGIVDILDAVGSILVTQNQPSTPTPSVLGGKVYVRVVAGATIFAGLPVGGFEAVVDSGAATNQMIVNSAYWNGPADASGVAEIVFTA